jgi:hypothetical protein
VDDPLSMDPCSVSEKRVSISRSPEVCARSRTESNDDKVLLLVDLASLLSLLVFRRRSCGHLFVDGVEALPWTSRRGCP